MGWFTVTEKPKRGWKKFGPYRINTERRWWGTAITSVSGPHPIKWWKRIQIKGER